MDSLLLPLLLLALAPGVLSHLQLQESGPGVLKPGETLTLTCTVTGGTVASSHYWHWIRQGPGQGLEWMGYWTGSTNYNPSLQGRITLSVDSSNTKYYLRLSSLTTADTGTYYCARQYNTWFEYWGQGTMVTVTSASNTAPSVFPLTSCTGEVTTSQVTFGCLAKGYFPEPVTVTWGPNVGSSGVRTYPSVLQPSSGLYSLSSQVTIPASSWTSDTYGCTVQHQPTSSSISKEIPKPSKPPKLEVFYSCTDSGAIQAVCLISHFNSVDLTVYWIVNSQTEKGTIDPPTKDADGQTFSTRSSFTLTEWTDDSPLVCQVSQPGSTPMQAHAHKCKG